MSDEPKIPPYLLAQRREREHTVDRSALCSCVNDDFQVNAECRICRGSGILPEPDEDELTPDQIRALGYEPLPSDHEANFQEQYIPGLGGSGRPHR